MKVGRQKDEPGGNAREHDDEGQCRQDASCAAPIEAADRELAALEIVEQAAADQIARYHEEDVDAGEAAGNGGDAEMEEHDGKHRNGPQAIDVAPVVHLAAPHDAVGGIRVPQLGALLMRRRPRYVEE